MNTEMILTSKMNFYTSSLDFEEAHMAERKRNYFGRYCHSTGLFTRPDGKRFKCSWDEYLEWVGKHRGLEVAHRLKMKHKKNNEAREKKNNPEPKVKIKLKLKE